MKRARILECDLMSHFESQVQPKTKIVRNDAIFSNFANEYFASD